jgi:hypothetical protein
LGFLTILEMEQTLQEIEKIERITKPEEVVAFCKL